MRSVVLEPTDLQTRIERNHRPGDMFALSEESSGGQLESHPQAETENSLVDPIPALTTHSAHFHK